MGATNLAGFGRRKRFFVAGTLLRGKRTINAEFRSCGGSRGTPGHDREQPDREHESQPRTILPPMAGAVMFAQAGPQGKDVSDVQGLFLRADHAVQGR